ncbi:MAG: Mrp/NBP35 family ATP-binding protein [Candidatus Eisenbacteria bacterium]
MADLQKVWAILREVRFPGLDKTIVDLGYVKAVEAEGERARIRLEIASSRPEAARAIEAEVRARLARAQVDCELEMLPPAAAPEETPKRPLIEDLAPGIRHKIAVASGKGGVGKSTVAVNLALGLAALGKRVGLLDADIHGPSVPTMLGVADRRPESTGGKLVPIEALGIRAISIGFLTGGLDPIIWRGPLASRAIEQLLTDVDWSGIDHLVLDLPPGTGDIQISIAQKANPSGVVIVTTPQDVALIDAIRGVRMFGKVEIPVLGIVENMSHFLCPHCGHASTIFPAGALSQELARMGVPVLARIPIDPAVAAGGDEGLPIVVRAPDSEVGRIYRDLAAEILRLLPAGADRPIPAS